MLPESALYHAVCGKRGGSGYRSAKHGMPIALRREIERALGGPLHAVSRQFLLETQPSHEVGPGYAEWLSWADAWNRNFDFAPVSSCIKAGFAIFGEAGDGAPYMVNTATNEVHLIGNGTIQVKGLDPAFANGALPFTKENMDRCAEEIWPTTLDFMSDLRTKVEDG